MVNNSLQRRARAEPRFPQLSNSIGAYILPDVSKEYFLNQLNPKHFLSTLEKLQVTHLISHLFESRVWTLVLLSGRS